MTLLGSPLMVRDDGADVLNFNWGYEGSPNAVCNVPGAMFSVRWTRSVTFTAGTYRFSTNSDDGMRLYIDGNKVQDRWYDQSANLQTVDVPLSGTAHTLVVEYYQNRGGESAAISWLLVPSTPLSITALVPNAVTSGTSPVMTVTGWGMDPTFQAYIVSGGLTSEILNKQFVSTSSVQVTPAIGGAGDSNAKLRMTVGGQTAETALQIMPPIATGCSGTVAGDRWKGEYFNNMTLSGSPLMVRDDGTDVLNFNWGNEGSPSTVCNIPGAMYSVRWTRSVTFTAGTYRFSTSSDDGMRLYVDGQKVQDRWYDQSANLQTVDVPLTGGAHSLVVEYYQNRGGESAAVSWQLL